jgi:hypothetical protein
MEMLGTLPPFDPDTGRLPEGEHAADWDEILARFGWTVLDPVLLDLSKGRAAQKARFGGELSPMSSKPIAG